LAAPQLTLSAHFCISRLDLEGNPSVGSGGRLEREPLACLVARWRIGSWFPPLLVIACCAMKLRRAKRISGKAMKMRSDFMTMSSVDRL
jgi:hypothetical protein